MKSPPSDRNRAIAARRAEGATFKAIGAEFGIGPQRAKELADRVARFDRGQALLCDNPGSIEGLHLAGQLPRLAFLSLEAAGIRRIGDLDGMTLVDLLRMTNIGRRVAIMLIDRLDKRSAEDQQ